MDWEYFVGESRTETDLIFDEFCILEPPKAIRKTEYFCDRKFHVSTLLELYLKPELCGLIWVAGENCSLYTIDMTSLETKNVDKTSTRLKKHNKGGSSSARFGRLHKEAIVHYLKNIVEDSVLHFNSSDIQYIFILGNGERKDELISYLPSSLKCKLAGNLTVEKEIDFLKIVEIYKEKKRKEEEVFLSYFLNEINNEKEKNKAIYGPELVLSSLKEGTLSTLYISKDNKEKEYFLSLCKEKGCKIYILSYISFNKFGDIFGILWF